MGTGVPGLLCRLDRLSESWLRFNAQVAERKNSEQPPAFKELPRNIRKLVTTITNDMRKINKTVQRLREKQPAMATAP